MKLIIIIGLVLVLFTSGCINVTINDECCSIGIHKTDTETPETEPKWDINITELDILVCCYPEECLEAKNNPENCDCVYPVYCEKGVR